MPFIKSSIIILSSGLSKLSTDFFASSIVSQISTPLPAARPSYLITIGIFLSSKYSFAFLESLNSLYFAVGRLLEDIKFFENTFEPSSCAKYFLGPKILRFFSSNKSLIPLTNGTSGPTIVKSILFSSAKFNTAS